MRVKEAALKPVSYTLQSEDAVMETEEESQQLPMAAKGAQRIHCMEIHDHPSVCGAEAGPCQ